jgi:hypothetical protein
MADCTTFDLLLVDWLYDELEPAEAARFTRHIDGCEACWHTAEAMTRIRALMRALPEEPPPEAALVRILHQAAEQVAGTRRRGLWAWLAGSLEFAWAHPAAAAMATLVLVAGVAGALFARGQLEMAAPDGSVSANRAQLRAGEAPAADDQAALGNAIAAVAAPPAPAPEIVLSSEKRAAAPGEEQRHPASGTRGQVRRDTAAAEREASKRLEATLPRAGLDLPQALPALAVAPDMRDESDPLQARQAGPHDDDARDRADREGGLGAGRTAGPSGGIAASVPAGASAATPAGEPDGVPGGAAGDAAETTPRTTGTAKPSTGSNTKPDDKSEQAQPRQAARKGDERTWAETMHDAMRVALRQEECARAVRIAEDIRARDPGYYRTRIADGKELAACRQPAGAQGQSGRKTANEANEQ